MTKNKKNCKAAFDALNPKIRTALRVLSSELEVAVIIKGKDSDAAKDIFQQIASIVTQNDVPRDALLECFRRRPPIEPSLERKDRAVERHPQHAILGRGCKNNTKPNLDFYDNATTTPLEKREGMVEPRKPQVLGLHRM